MKILDGTVERQREREILIPISQVTFRSSVTPELRVSYVADVKVKRKKPWPAWDILTRSCSILAY